MIFQPGDLAVHKRQGYISIVLEIYPFGDSMVIVLDYPDKPEYYEYFFRPATEEEFERFTLIQLSR